MTHHPPPKVDEALWASALLSTDSELLLGAARNYLGPVKTPYDKREIVGRLTAFLKKAEVREAVVALADGLDARILGTCYHLGPLPESELRALFEGELPLFDLGIRLANLQDRLLLFRFESGGRRYLALNPILTEALLPLLMDPHAVFGPPSGSPDGGGPGLSLPQALKAQDCVAFFLFLLHLPGGLRKGGSLTKKALDKVLALLPQFAPTGEGLQVLVKAFQAAGFLGAGSEEREADPQVFAEALEAWGEELPAYLAAALAQGAPEAGEAWTGLESAVVEAGAAAAAALAAAPPGFRFSRGGFARWFEIVQRRSRRGLELGLPLALADLVEALVSLGLLVDDGEVVVVNLPWPRGSFPSPEELELGATSEAPEAPEPSSPPLVAEGSHALHLLPEASLGQRLFVGRLGRLTSAATVWSFEVDRESVRRAFATGLDAAGIVEGLVALGGRPLPQALSFSLKAWEEEYRSLRLYRGFVLAVDDRLKPVVEASKVLAPHLAERLAPGVYVLAVASPEEAAALLEEAGLEPPPESHHSSPASSGLPASGASAKPRGRLRARAAAGDLARSVEQASPRAVLDPKAHLASLLAALEDQGHAKVSRGAPELKELMDRIERRLILTPKQLEGADLHPERLEAGGLDYLGKVRIVERSLRGQGDRLEILYRLPGEEPKRVLARPVRLDKTEKGLVLEAEDLGTGGPIRIPLGAASSVRRMRASLFGEDT